jgi:hypothetical protein
MAVDLTDEQAQWLRGLLGTSHLPDEGGINQLIMPDEVCAALAEKNFVRRRNGTVEVTPNGIDAVWQYTLAQRLRGEGA